MQKLEKETISAPPGKNV